MSKPHSTGSIYEYAPWHIAHYGITEPRRDARMARLGRIVVPGFPHHVTQRGNRRRQVFFEPSDGALDRDLLAARCRKAPAEVWAYCLMPNHVHLVLTPQRRSPDEP